MTQKLGNKSGFKINYFDFIISKEIKVMFLKKTKLEIITNVL